MNHSSRYRGISETWSTQLRNDLKRFREMFSVLGGYDLPSTSDFAKYFVEDSKFYFQDTISASENGVLFLHQIGTSGHLSLVTMVTKEGMSFEILPTDRLKDLQETNFEENNAELLKKSEEGQDDISSNYLNKTNEYVEKIKNLKLTSELLKKIAKVVYQKMGVGEDGGGIGMVFDGLELTTGYVYGNCSIEYFKNLYTLYLEIYEIQRQMEIKLTYAKNLADQAVAKAEAELRNSLTPEQRRTAKANLEKAKSNANTANTALEAVMYSIIPLPKRTTNKTIKPFEKVQER